MKRPLEVIRDISSEVVREVVPGFEPRFDASRLTSDQDIMRARQLSAERYVTQGKIKPEELDENGIIRDDPYSDKSIYFGVYENNDMLATTRIIWSPDSKVSDLRMPIEELDEKSQAFLLAQEPGTVAEISSLAKVKGVSNVATLKLLRELFMFADENAIEQMVCGLEPKLLPLYNKLFGGALVPLSDTSIEYPDFKGEQAPFTIDLYGSYKDQREEMKKRSIGERALGLVVRNYFRYKIPKLR